MPLDIMLARTEDAEAILALQRLAYQSEAVLYNDFSIPPLRQTLDELRAEITTQIVLKAVDEGQIVGSVRAVLKDDTCLIGRLMVHPDYQGRGIGKSLMHEIESRCADSARFELFTGDKSQGNIRLYEKLGYVMFRAQVLNDQVRLVYLEKRP